MPAGSSPDGRLDLHHGSLRGTCERGGDAPADSFSLLRVQCENAHGATNPADTRPVSASTPTVNTSWLDPPGHAPQAPRSRPRATCARCESVGAFGILNALEANKATKSSSSGGSSTELHPTIGCGRTRTDLDTNLGGC